MSAMFENDDFLPPVADAHEEHLVAINNLNHGNCRISITTDHPLSVTIRDLGTTMTTGRRRDLESMVALSMQASEAIAAVSFVTGDVREVADNTQTIAAAIEELNTTINEISASSHSVVEAAHATEEAISKGQAAVQSSVRRIDTIAETMGLANDRLENLSEAVSAIAGMLGSIESIAKQTNLLALNATIEAARAGAAGKGFAVVASEVKELAGQTAKATDEIRQRIAAITDGMREMSDAMMESVGSVDAGRSEIHKAGDEIDTVVKNIQDVTRLMASTASSVTEQSAALEEIGRSIEIIRHKTARSAENAESAVTSVNASSTLIETRLGDFANMDIPESVIDFAMSDHIAWKKKLAGMLVGAEKLTAEELSDHKNCRLGKWCSGVTDPSVKNSAAFKGIEKPHADVHVHGKRAAELFSKGDRQGAQAVYDEMVNASAIVIERLNELKGSR
ncbi:MAG: hypothetical protein EOM26_06375 [Alphaproteobacteria bacterium]|nr:hypothetical protein [Alphaproteobacteria bacterium]